MLPIILDYWALVENNVFMIWQLSAHHPGHGVGVVNFLISLIFKRETAYK